MAQEKMELDLELPPGSAAAPSDGGGLRRSNSAPLIHGLRWARPGRAAGRCVGRAGSVGRLRRRSAHSPRRPGETRAVWAQRKRRSRCGTGAVLSALHPSAARLRQSTPQLTCFFCCLVFPPVTAPRFFSLTCCELAGTAQRLPAGTAW